MSRPRKREQCDIELPPPGPDDEIYVTSTLGARVLGTTSRTVRRWRSLGLVEEIMRMENGRRAFVYRLSDLTDLDARLRSAA